MAEQTQKKPKKIAPRVDMPAQDAKVRARNFEEVALGYSQDDAMTEAGRCLLCKKPKCQSGCPVEVDIKGFIAKLRDGDLIGAHQVIKNTNSLPAVCGRVCPQETQCEGACILGKKGEPVAIGRLERYVADTFAADDACQQVTGEAACVMSEDEAPKVACIGSGPASLTAAGMLAANGVRVTVFEALHEPGGVLVYGIPEFRLPKDIVRREIDAMKDIGVDVVCNMVGGRSVTVQNLFAEGYQAVFIGVGAGLPRFLGIPGESAIGVYSANEYLTRVNLGRAYDADYHTPVQVGKHVVVLGGGNVAMDAARTALRLGADKVSILYRRTQKEMPARLEEVHHAVEEGVEIMELVGPVEYLHDENRRLTGMRLQRMELSEPDDSGRRRPVPIEGDIIEIKCDQAVVAVGSGANRVLLERTPEIELNKWGNIVVNDDTGESTYNNVFAGGDIVTGAATVIEAMGAGRRAAKEILRRVLGREVD